MRYDWRRLPPQILLAILATCIVVPIVAWQQLRGDGTATEIDSAASAPADGAADAGDEAPPAPSSTIALPIQPGWVPKGSSRYGDNGSGGDALPIITTPVPRVDGAATTTIPARVKDPKTTTPTTTPTTTKPKPPVPTSPPATAPPATAPPATSPPATQPPPTAAPPTAPVITTPPAAPSGGAGPPAVP